MKKRLLNVLLACALTAGLTLAGCGSSSDTTQKTDSGNAEEADNDTVVIPVFSEISSFYTIGSGDLTGDILSANFDDLWIVKDEKTVDYYVAKGCDISEDGLTYTVTLNEGIKWHDGENLTADDLVYTINDMDWMGYLPYFAGGPVVAEKVDDYTVSVKLEKPSNGFFQRLGTVRVMPKHLYEGVSTEEMMTCDAAMGGIGMGPYKLVEWNQGESLVFERFDDYYRGTPAYKKVIFKVMPDESAQQLAFDKGEINVLRINNKTNLDKYSADESANILELRENRISFLVTNPSSTRLTTKEQKEALFAAINQEEIINQVWGDSALATEAAYMAVDSTKYMDSTLKNYDYDLEKAKELVQSSGLSDVTLKLYYSVDRIGMEDTAMVLEQQFKAAGINVELVGTEAVTWATDWQMGSDEIDILLNGWDSMQGDPGFEWAIYGDGSAMHYMAFSEDTVQLIDKANTSLTEDDLTANWQAFQKSAYEDYWAKPLFETNYVLAIKKGLSTFDEEQPSTFWFEDFLKTAN